MEKELRERPYFMSTLAKDRPVSQPALESAKRGTTLALRRLFVVYLLWVYG